MELWKAAIPVPLFLSIAFDSWAFGIHREQLQEGSKCNISYMIGWIGGVLGVPMCPLPSLQPCIFELNRSGFCKPSSESSCRKTLIVHVVSKRWNNFKPRGPLRLQQNRRNMKDPLAWWSFDWFVLWGEDLIEVGCRPRGRGVGFGRAVIKKTRPTPQYYFGTL